MLFLFEKERESASSAPSWLELPDPAPEQPAAL
jgi:hypothetical protein